METEIPVAEKKKASKVNVLTVSLIVLVLAAMGLGTWGILLNNELIATEETRKSLQAEYDALASQNKELQAEFDTAQANLEEAKADLSKSKEAISKTETKLTSVQASAVSLQADLAQALKYVEVASGYLVEKNTLVAIEKKVEAVGDPTLNEKFKKFKYTINDENFMDWMVYLFTALTNLLK